MKARPLLNPHSPRPTPFAPILVVAAALLSGCATSQPLVLTDAVGPAEAAHGPRPALGTLVVYSAWDGQSTLDPGHLKHTPYEVLSSDGVKLLRVPNQRGPFGGDPQSVQLAPGRYRIEARASNLGPVEAPVEVRAGETTMLYLDGTTAGSATAASSENWVRRPDGAIVGWRASAK